MLVSLSALTVETDLRGPRLSTGRTCLPAYVLHNIPTRVSPELWYAISWHDRQHTRCFLAAKFDSITGGTDMRLFRVSTGSQCEWISPRWGHRRNAVTLFLTSSSVMSDA